MKIADNRRISHSLGGISISPEHAHPRRVDESTLVLFAQRMAPGMLAAIAVSSVGAYANRILEQRYGSRVLQATRGKPQASLEDCMFESKSAPNYHNL